MTDAENVSQKRVEAAARAMAREATLMDLDKPELEVSQTVLDMASDDFWRDFERTARAALTADALYAASRYADGVRDGLRMARHFACSGGYNLGRLVDEIDARIKEGT